MVIVVGSIARCIIFGVPGPFSQKGTNNGKDMAINF